MMTNWGGNHTYRAASVLRPSTLDGLQQLIASSSGLAIVGSRHSFNAIGDGAVLVDLSALASPPVVDIERGVVSVGGATNYAELARTLAGHDVALHNLASLAHISVAGAIGTGTHGSGSQLGNLATAVESIEMITSSGELMNFRRGDDDFGGAVVHLGALGLVMRFELRIEESYDVEQTVYDELEWSTLTGSFDDVFDSATSVSVFTRWGSTVGELWCKQRGDGRARTEVTETLQPAATPRHPIPGMSAAACTTQGSEPGPWWNRLPHFRADSKPSAGDEIQSEFFVAAAADVAICAVGDKSGLTADCTTGESRDATSLRLPGVQEDLVHAVAATGTPVGLVIISGRPVGSPEIHGAAGAVLVGWLPGQAGGTAIAEAVAGVFSPGGKLPITYPRTSGQVPIYYAHKPSGGRSHWKGPYVDCSNLPLYPFGHGLTYSDFTISVVEGGDQPVTVGIDDSVDVSVEVANVGDRCADEVVQVYARHRAASVTQPVLSLQAFSRVTVEAGSSTRIDFRVPVRALGFAGVDKTHVIEPGVVEFFVGSSSASASLARTAAISVDGPTPARRVMSDTPTTSATTSTTRSTP